MRSGTSVPTRTEARGRNAMTIASREDSITGFLKRAAHQEMDDGYDQAHGLIEDRDYTERKDGEPDGSPYIPSVAEMQVRQILDRRRKDRSESR